MAKPSKDKNAAPVNKNYKDRSGKNADSPQCMYYYHISLKGDGTYQTRTYFMDKRRPIPASEVIAIMTDLAANAHHNGRSPSPCGWGVKDLFWRRKSYFAVVLDDPGNELVKDDGLYFRSANNHTFLDGNDVDVDVSSDEDASKLRSGLWCINYMMKEDGTDVDEWGEKFEIHFNSNSKRIFYPNDSGTNMGPPVPPP